VQLIAELRDYSVTLNAATVKAGPTKIGIRNRAGQVHNFLVIRTDLPPDKLPYDGGRAMAKEDGALAKSKDLRAGGTGAVTVTLEPGSYVVICNTAGHYQLGMRTALTVD
jgi:uncharacterized cupredoxin-like copper-binding protein